MSRAERSLAQLIIPSVLLGTLALYVFGGIYYSTVLPDAIVSAQATTLAQQPGTNNGQDVCANKLFPSHIQNACRRALLSTVAIAITADANPINASPNCSATVLRKKRQQYILELKITVIMIFS